MKIVFRAFITAALLCVLTLSSALAAPPETNTETDYITYSINELDMTIDFPASLYVFTRTIDPIDPGLALFNLEKEWLETFFQENNVYLNAISDKVTYEYYVEMTADPEIQGILDFSACNDSYLQTFIKNSKPLYQKSGENYLSTEIYRTEQTAYLKSNSEYNVNGIAVNCISYFTIEDGAAYSIFLLSYDQAPIAEREALLTKAVDSAAIPGLSATEDPDTTPSLVSPSPITSPSPVTSPSLNPSASAEPTQTSEPSGPENQNLPFWLLLVIYLGATLMLVTVPIIIYRYIIRRSAVSKKIAVLIALIYGTITCIAIAFYIYFTGHIYLISGAIIWSLVNYFILSRGKVKAKPLPSPSKPDKPKKQDKPKKTDERKLRKKNNETNFSDIIMSKPCKKCLAVNLADSDVCFYCGAKLDDEETTTK